MYVSMLPSFMAVNEGVWVWGQGISKAKFSLRVRECELNGRDISQLKIDFFRPITVVTNMQEIFN